MKRSKTLGWILTIHGLTLGLTWPSEGQVTAPAAPGSTAKAAPASSLELALLRSLRANAVTAPYSFTTEPRGKQVLLKGRVGTKQVHDVAIQTAIALGIPVVDGLVIDTAEAHRAAYSAQASLSGVGGSGSGYSGTGFYGSPPYLYPQPILGKIDDPFYGFEPPAFSFPPWWGALTARRLGPPAGQPTNNPPVPPDPSTTSTSPAPPDQGNPIAGSLPYGTIDMAIDPRGVATLRGTVPSLAERITLGQRVAQTPGVSQVINLLNVQANPPSSTSAPSDTPPPIPMPPTQAEPAAAPRAINIPEGPPIVVDNDSIGQRATRAVASRATLSGAGVRVKVRDGVASLTGTVPTVYEAMLAYRAVQQTPGVREIEDRLEFVVPDGLGVNPLVEKGRPDEVEPYLEAQIRRQVGDLAHVDRVRMMGNALDLKGTLGREEDRERFDAIIRSMPILRGFRLTAEVATEPR